MNREIKFRVWNSPTMYYPADKSLRPSNCDSMGFPCVSHSLENCDYIESNAIIQQYIGLQDFSGKDIYEGDILMDKNQLLTGIWYEVIFDRGWFVAEYEDVKGRPHRRDIAETEFLIMGNKFENPELMELKK